MPLVGIDLGATKLAAAVFSSDGDLLRRNEELIRDRDVGSLVQEIVRETVAETDGDVRGVGMCVPGIYYQDTGRVWAPNIPGWDDYPLLDVLRESVDRDVLVRVESDRACCILGEIWKGAARGCTDAVFVAVGTGIGAGIFSGGRIINGARGIAGAIGWLALDRPYRDGYETYGCFEYWAAGDGLARAAEDLMDGTYQGSLRGDGDVDARRIFEAYAQGDELAKKVIDRAIAFWGMATANLVSLLNPQKIIFGGGVFGPAADLLDRITEEARRWAQPISMEMVSIEASQLGAHAALYGAARLAGSAPDDEPI